MIRIHPITRLLTEQVEEILVRATHDVGILQVLQDSRHQPDRLMRMGLPEVKVIIDNSLSLMRILQELHHPWPKGGIERIIRTDDKNVICLNAWEGNLQALRWVVFVESVLGISVGIEKR